MTTTELVTPAHSFTQAFEVWISNRTLQQQPGRFTSARYISERTEWDYRQYARALGKMFGEMPLGSIHVGHLREYHRARAFCDNAALTNGGWHKKAAANRIRQEVNLLIRIMRSGGCWTEELDRFFQPLQKEESDVARALDASEQERFLAIAASRPEYSFVLWYSVAALQTCCSTNELRTLRLGDVNLEHAAITIRTEGAKNKFRRRTIPLESNDVVWAFERLVERARDLGAVSPHHYLFPAMLKRNDYDPTKPMSDSGLKKRWDEVRRAADLKWLRPYDLRHTAITRLAESGVPIATIMALAGHVSVKMQQHYTTISMMAKRKAVASTWSSGAPFAARAGATPKLHPAYQQVIEKRG